MKITPREMRLKHGFYQNYVAKKIGMDIPTYCLKENGKRPFTLQDVLKLAKFYNVPVEKLKV